MSNSILFGNHARKVTCAHGFERFQYCHDCDCVHLHYPQAHCHICDSAETVPHCTSCEENPAATLDLRRELGDTVTDATPDELLACASNPAFWTDEDEVPHCRMDGCENPADEGPDDLCTECRISADYLAHGAPQEENTWANRGGCSYRLDDTDRAVYVAMDDGYRKQTFFARASALAGLLLVLSIGSASASDYTPTAPIGCTITHYWEQDDMSAIAVCAGGYTVHKEAGPIDDWNDIPYAVGSITVGPDAAGAYHDFPVWD